MTPTNKDIKVLGRVVSVAVDNIVVDAEQVHDSIIGKDQATINSELRSGNLERVFINGSERITIDKTSGIIVDQEDSDASVTIDHNSIILSRGEDIVTIDLNGISVDGTVTADTITASNTVNTSNLNADNATIGDDLTVRGTLHADNANVDGSLTVDGPATFNGGITTEPGDTLTVEGEDGGNIVLRDGEITCDTLTAVDNVVTNELTADGDVTFNSGLSIREDL